MSKRPAIGSLERVAHRHGTENLAEKLEGELRKALGTALELYRHEGSAVHDELLEDLENGLEQVKALNDVGINAIYGEE